MPDDFPRDGRPGELAPAPSATPAHAVSSPGQRASPQPGGLAPTPPADPAHASFAPGQRAAPQPGGLAPAPSADPAHAVSSPGQRAAPQPGGLAPAPSTDPAHAVSSPGQLAVSQPAGSIDSTPAGTPVGWPFHLGELAAQQLAGGGSAGGAIRSFMPDQHRRFFAQLPFVAVATTDGNGPVATLWTGPPGFVTSPDPRTLRIAVALDPADPASRAFVAGAPFGLLGIELATRRRNRANGAITAVAPDGLTVAIRQSFGNCPSYIHPRDVLPAPASAPASAALAEPLHGLDGGAAAAITAADTFFVATSARTAEPTGGVDISHRGGPPGFVRIDGDVLTIPDYRGNRYFNTLGNLVSDPRAALVFVDFARGDLLHLQGRAEIQWDGPEVSALDGAERLWRFHVERGWRRRSAVPLRWTAPAG
jgi:predicted pyridoxine 5'-phosphate oxidase superfamily flavin-nucleotide-binding protein